MGFGPNVRGRGGGTSHNCAGYTWNCNATAHFELHPFQNSTERALTNRLSKSNPKLIEHFRQFAITPRTELPFCRSHPLEGR